jgi:Ca-activated chloride channel family protein
MKPNRADAGKMNAGIRAGLAQFIRAGNASDEYFLMGFSKGVELLSDWTRDGESLPGKTEVARPKGQTAFYDACYAAAEKLGREARHRPVLVLISDCEDNASRRGFGEVRRALLEGMAQVYVVMPLRYASDGGGGSALYDACGDTRKLASETGGRVYDRGKTPGISEVGTYENIFEHMSLELRRQYTIGYKPSRPAEDGKWHRIKVVVKAAKDSSGKTPSLSVFSREGYLAKRGALNK